MDDQIAQMMDNVASSVVSCFGWCQIRLELSRPKIPSTKRQQSKPNWLWRGTTSTPSSASKKICGTVNGQWIETDLIVKDETLLWLVNEMSGLCELLWRNLRLWISPGVPE